MNLWSHHFFQNTNKKLSGFLLSLHRASILTIFLGETIFCPYFGRKDDFIHSFWNCLIFNGIPTTSCEIVIRYFLFHHSGAVVVDGHYVMKNVKMVWHIRENARFWPLINLNKKITKKMVKSNIKHIFQTTIVMPHLRNRDTSKSFH